MLSQSRSGRGLFLYVSNFVFQISPLPQHEKVGLVPLQFASFLYSKPLLEATKLSTLCRQVD